MINMKFHGHHDILLKSRLKIFTRIPSIWQALQMHSHDFSPCLCLRLRVQKCLCRLSEVKPQTSLAKFDSPNPLQKLIANAGGPGLSEVGLSEKTRLMKSRDLETLDSNVELITEKSRVFIVK